MKKERLTTRQQLENWKNGMYESKDCSTQIDAGWFDWFCQDSSLAGKTNKLFGYLDKIKDSDKIDLDNTYVFFKNNCPMDGALYDDFRICDIESGDVIFTIIPRSGHRSYQRKGIAGQVWGKANKFEEPLFEGEGWKEVKEWFLTPSLELEPGMTFEMNNLIHEITNIDDVRIYCTAKNRNGHILAEMGYVREWVEEKIKNQIQAKS